MPAYMVEDELDRLSPTPINNLDLVCEVVVEDRDMAVHIHRWETCQEMNKDERNQCMHIQQQHSKNKNSSQDDLVSSNKEEVQAMWSIDTHVDFG